MVPLRGTPDTIQRKRLRFWEFLLMIFHNPQIEIFFYRLEIIGKLPPKYWVSRKKYHGMIRFGAVLWGSFGWRKELHFRKQFELTMDRLTAWICIGIAVLLADFLTSWIKPVERTPWEDDEIRRRG